MRDPKKLPLVCGVAIVTLGALVADYAGVTDPASAGLATRVVASNGKLTPALMDTKVGTVTTLKLTSSQGTYGLESARLGIATTMITAGKVTSISFTPKTAGTFAVRCVVNCGAGRDQMVLTINVVP